MDQRSPSATGAANAATIRVVVSTDGGRTFGAPFAVDGDRAVDQFDPTVAVLPSGRTYVGWFEDDGAGARHVRVATAASPEGPYVTAPPLDDGVEAVDRPWLAASGSEVYVAWVGAPSHRVYYTRSDDNGSTFAAPTVGSTGGLMLGCVAVSGDGAVWVVANDYEGLTNPTIVAVRSADGSPSFGAPEQLGTLSRAGRTIVRCAADTDGILVAWVDRTGPDDLSSPSFFDADLHFTRVTAGGVQPPVSVPVPSGFQPVAFPPASAMADQPRVAYYARRTNGASYDQDWAPFVATIATDGTGTAVQVTPAPSPGEHLESLTPPTLDISRWLGDTSALVVSGGVPIDVFSDNAAGDADVYAVRVQ